MRAAVGATSPPATGVLRFAAWTLLSPCTVTTNRGTRDRPGRPQPLRHARCCPEHWQDLQVWSKLRDTYLYNVTNFVVHDIPSTRAGNAVTIC